MMRIGALTGLLALGIAASAVWAQPTLTHLQSVDLSSYFTANGPLGDSVSDVAFDGRNLYIAGFSVANTADPVPVGVLKIANVLSPDPNQWNYTPLISLTQAAQSRVSYVVYKDGFLYLGTGLGDGSGSPARTGVRKFDANTGAQDTNWNGTGVVMPTDLTPGTTTRMECVAIDPGYQGSGESLAILARARGFIFRRDFATGSALPNILATPTRPDNTTTTGMRDITFAPNGDAYLRVDNSVWYAQRTGANTVLDNRANLLLDFSSDNPFQVHINVLYLPTPSGDLLLFNRRDGNNTYRKVFAYLGSGSSWSPYLEITGDEPLPDGTTPNAFARDLLNFTYGDGPDPSAGDVNLDGTVDDADLLQVLFAFGSSDRSADVNGDGTVDDADLLTVLFNFGSNPTARYLFVIQANFIAGDDRLDIYRVNP
jgi:hypothetical protein